FIPVASDWRERSTWIVTHGSVSYFHFDLYAQALAKLERGHEQDLADIEQMLSRELIDRAKTLEYFAEIEPNLYRFPAVDPVSFRQVVTARMTRS
ncbi:MAG: DUF6036 family nucleotidyltransferase, partial [Acidimicrobiia bacterium]